MNLRACSLSLLGVTTLLTLACGSGGGGGNTPPPPPPVASALSFVDATAGPFQLKKNTRDSRTDLLVLDLVASQAGQGAGVSLQLTVDGTKASWTKIAASDPEFARNGAVFTLGNAPQAFKGKVTGSTLHVALSQKGLANAATLNGVVASFGLSLKPGQAPGPVSLDVVTGKSKVLKADGQILPLDLSKGVLNAQ